MNLHKIIERLQEIEKEEGDVRVYYEGLTKPVLITKVDIQFKKDSPVYVIFE